MNAATIVIAVMVIVPILLLLVDIARSRAGGQAPVEEAADDLPLAPQRESGVDRPDQVLTPPAQQAGERRRIGEREMRRAGQLEQRAWPAQARREPRQARASTVVRAADDDWEAANERDSDPGGRMLLGHAGPHPQAARRDLHACRL
jgi:hypothetical protein